MQGYGANPVKKGLAQSGSKDQLALDSEGEDWLTAEGVRSTGGRSHPPLAHPTCRS